MAWTASTTRPRLGYAPGKDKDYAAVHVRCAHTRHSSQPSKAGCNSPDLTARDATLYRRLVAKVKHVAMDRADIPYTASIFGSPASCPKEADKGQVQESGTVLCSGDRPDGHTTGGGKQGTIRPHHWVHRQRRAINEWRNARPQWRAGEILLGATKTAISEWSWDSEFYVTVIIGVEVIGLPRGPLEGVTCR